MIVKKTTNQLIYASLLDLLRSQELQKITVQSIMKNCGMSTMTFYRHFVDKSDLIIWHQIDVIRPALNGLGSICNWEDFLNVRILSILEEKALYLSLFNYKEGHDLYVFTIENHILPLIKEKLLQLNHKEILSPQEDFSLRYYIMSTALCSINWVIKESDTPVNLSLEQLLFNLVNVIPSDIRTLFDFPNL